VGARCFSTWDRFWERGDLGKAFRGFGEGGGRGWRGEGGEGGEGDAEKERRSEEKHVGGEQQPVRLLRVPETRERSRKSLGSSIGMGMPGYIMRHSNPSTNWKQANVQRMFLIFG
jgi:hypothetical protein